MIRLRSLLWFSSVALLAGAVGWWIARAETAGRSTVRAEAGSGARSGSGGFQDPSLGPGLLPVDAFHPDRRPGPDGELPELPPPAYGGRASVWAEQMPKNLCATLDNTGLTRRILYELHETLLLRDWETTQWKPDLAYRYDVQDRLVLKPGAVPIPEEYLVGTVSEKGDSYVVDPKPGYASPDVPIVKKTDVERIERGTVLTFRLKPRVRWHDGHPFDARDVAFSARIYRNEQVRCGEKRDRFLKISKIEVLDSLTVRFTLEHQYFNALDTIGDMCLLPAHLYDLSDPDNEDGKAKRAADPDWKPSDEEEARYVNENPRNRDWVGLGPYRLDRWTADGIEAVRNEDYFEPKNAGYLDGIRWRSVPDEQAAFQAVLNGELDFFWKMSADDYFGASTQSPAFQERCYKGYFYTAEYWYVGWNLYRPELADARVRRALAMLFDFKEFQRTFYKGLAMQVTGPGSVYAPGYDRELLPLPYDPTRAKALLDESGWADHDGDGVRDKDGTSLSIDLLIPASSKPATAFGAKFQEDLARAGIRLKLSALEMGTLIERRGKRDFDAVALGWSPPLESDPEQIWHSKGAAQDVVSSNFVGLRDGEVDGLIARGQVELDADKRAAIWRELHRRIYELQPYLFCYNPPRKFAMNRAIRGFQSVPPSPNYVVRRWYYPAGTPGTRPTLEAGDRADSPLRPPGKTTR